MSVRPRVRGSNGPYVELTTGTWTEIRLTIPAGSGSASQTGLLINAGAAQIGDRIDIDGALLVEGEYDGPYFDGDTAGDDQNQYSWTGTPNSSTSLWQRRMLAL